MRVVIGSTTTVCIHVYWLSKGGGGRENNAARGEADCCIVLETQSRVLYSAHCMTNHAQTSMRGRFKGTTKLFSTSKFASKIIVLLPFSGCLYIHNIYNKFNIRVTSTIAHNVDGDLSVG